MHQVLIILILEQYPLPGSHSHARKPRNDKLCLCGFYTSLNIRTLPLLLPIPIVLLGWTLGNCFFLFALEHSIRCMDKDKRCVGNTHTHIHTHHSLSFILEALHLSDSNELNLLQPNLQEDPIVSLNVLLMLEP